MYVLAEVFQVVILADPLRRIQVEVAAVADRALRDNSSHLFLRIASQILQRLHAFMPLRGRLLDIICPSPPIAKTEER